MLKRRTLGHVLKRRIYTYGSQRGIGGRGAHAAAHRGTRGSTTAGRAPRREGGAWARASHGRDEKPLRGLDTCWAGGVTHRPGLVMRFSHARGTQRPYGRKELGRDFGPRFRDAEPHACGTSGRKTTEGHVSDAARAARAAGRSGRPWAPTPSRHESPPGLGRAAETLKRRVQRKACREPRENYACLFPKPAAPSRPSGCGRWAPGASCPREPWGFSAELAAGEEAVPRRGFNLHVWVYFSHAYRHSGSPS